MHFQIWLTSVHVAKFGLLAFGDEHANNDRHSEENEPKDLSRLWAIIHQI